MQSFHSRDGQEGRKLGTDVRPPRFLAAGVHGGQPPDRETRGFGTYGEPYPLQPSISLVYATR